MSIKCNAVLPVVFAASAKTPKAFKYNGDQVYGFMGKNNDFYPTINFSGLGGKLKKSRMFCPLFVNVSETPVGNAYHLYISPMKSKRTVMTIKPMKESE